MEIYWQNTNKHTILNMKYTRTPTSTTAATKPKKKKRRIHNVVKTINWMKKDEKIKQKNVNSKNLKKWNYVIPINPNKLIWFQSNWEWLNILFYLISQMTSTFTDDLINFISFPIYLVYFFVYFFFWKILLLKKSEI